MKRTESIQPPSNDVVQKCELSRDLETEHWVIVLYYVYHNKQDVNEKIEMRTARILCIWAVKLCDDGDNDGDKITAKLCCCSDDLTNLWFLSHIHIFTLD